MQRVILGTVLLSVLIGFICGCALLGIVEEDSEVSTAETGKPEVDKPELTVPEWEHEESLKAGVRHLLDTQNKDGSWGGYLPRRPYLWRDRGNDTTYAYANSTSALACMALLMQPSTPELDLALQRGYSQLIDARETRHVTLDTFFNVWSYTYMTEALARGLKDKRLETLHDGMRERCRAELDGLLRIQAIDGGWAYFDFGQKLYPSSGKISTTFNAGAALVALKAAQEVGFEIPERAVRIAIDYLFRTRFPYGTYGYSTSHTYYPSGDINKIIGSLCRTQVCDYGIMLWQDEAKENKNPRLTLDATRTSLDNFYELHDYLEVGRCRPIPHESWFAISGYFYYFGHYYAAYNVDLLKGDEKKRYADTLAQLIADSQDEDGAFWDFPIMQYSKPYGTGYAIVAMSLCKAAFK